jgi:hypothetical protein
LLTAVPPLVGSGQNDGRQLLAYRNGVRAHFVNEIFNVMSERRHVLKTKHGTRALDGMESAKDAVYGLITILLVSDVESNCFNFRQQVVGFLEKYLNEVRLHG